MRKFYYICPRCGRCYKRYIPKRKMKCGFCSTVWKTRKAKGTRSAFSWTATLATIIALVAIAFFVGRELGVWRNPVDFKAKILGEPSWRLRRKASKRTKRRATRKASKRRRTSKISNRRPTSRARKATKRRSKTRTRRRNETRSISRSDFNVGKRRDVRRLVGERSALRVGGRILPLGRSGRTNDVSAPLRSERRADDSAFEAFGDRDRRR